MKRRLFIRCMRSYAELFTGKKEEIAPESGSVLQQPYLWNDLMEDDQFAKNVAPDENVPIQGLEGSSNADQMKQLTAEGVKIQLNEMFKETISMFEGVKAKVALLK